MPDTRSHRGAGPEDSRLFSNSELFKLGNAVIDFSLLLSKGYGSAGALKLVGDHFGLTHRQRLAVMRSSCSDQQLNKRKVHEITTGSLAGTHLLIDGYNILITIEAALSGAPVFIGRDGCFRDISGIHGTYRKVEETIPAVQLIGTFLSNANVASAKWLLDAPVSNSGRLKVLLSEIANRYGWNWQIELSINPDKLLIISSDICVSSDSIILDSCSCWTNLAGPIMTSMIPEAWIINLSGI